MYIALFSRFTTCGSWEGHHILDFVVENESEVKPDTIHADTQGQSAAIFGLAHLLGIRLQPRIRNWKGLHLFRPDPDARYEHIDCLFTKRVDWDLIRENASGNAPRCSLYRSRQGQAVDCAETACNLFQKEQAVFRVPGTRICGADHVPARVPLRC